MMMTDYEPNAWQNHIELLKNNASHLVQKEVEQKEHPPLKKQEDTDQPIVADSVSPLTQEEREIIQSYPGNLHYLLTILVKTSKLTPSTSSYSQQELSNFKHNMRHIFVYAINYEGGWHSADLRTLWSDGWREQDIIRFMMAKKVKYIMCHDCWIIQCLKIEATFPQPSVYVFEKKNPDFHKAHRSGWQMFEKAGTFPIVF